MTVTRLSNDATLSALALSEGTLDPAFASAKDSYTASVIHSVAQITVTPTASAAGATVAYLDGSDDALADADGGTDGQQVDLSTGANTIKVKVTAEDGTTKTYTVTVTRAATAGTDATLSALALSAGTLDPVFGSATLTYTASVGNAVARITVTPTVNRAGAAVAYLDGSDDALADADGGTDGQQVDLSVGANTVKVKVTAEDGTTTKTYTVTVTRLSNDATLSALALSAGTLDPAFASAKDSYTASVIHSVAQITVTPTASAAGATVAYLDGSDDALADADGGTDGQQVDLSTGANTIKVKVTAEDGTTKTYTVTVTRAATAGTDATLSALALSAGTLDPVFGSATLTYTASVGNAVARITVTPTVNHAGAAVAYLDGGDDALADADGGTDGQQVDLSVGANTVKVKVTAEDGTTTKTYTVTVTRLSNDATLSALALSEGTLDPAFASAKDSYTASVIHSVAQITVTPTASAAGATVAYLDGSDDALADADGGTDGHQVDLSTGANTIKVKVTAEDGTTKTYTVTVTRAATAGTDATLSALALSAGTLDPVFGSATLTYTASVGNAVARITVTPTVNHAGAAVAYLDGSDDALADADGGTDGQQVDLSVGANTVKVKVTAEDGTTTKTYTVTVTRLSNDATLSALALSEGTLDPAFASAKDSYTASVIHSVAQITVTPTASAAGATVAYLDGSDDALADADGGTDGQQVDLSTGANTIKVKVTAEDGTTKTYTVTVTRAATAGTDATLSALALSAGTLDPVFGSATLTYTASVGNAVARITVTPTVNHAGAAVAYLDGSDDALADADGGTDGQQVDLSVGANTVKVKVTAEDGTTTKTYTVTVTRLSNDATLSALALSEGTLDPAFASAKDSYTASVIHSVAQITVTPTASAAGATVAYLDGSDDALADADGGTDGQQVDLSTGANTIKVKVTAEDGTTKTYTVTVTRAATAGTDATLSALALSAGTLDPVFGSATLTYTASVGNAVARITVTPTVNRAGAAVAYLDGGDDALADADGGTDGQQVDLSVGANTVKVKVTAEDGTTTKTYTVTVTRLSNDATLSALALSEGTLDPAFASAKDTYTASVIHSVAQITVTPTASAAGATVAYLDGSDDALADADGGTDGQQVDLSTGANTIKVKVTAEDGATTKTYTVTVTRPSNDATAGLVIDPAALAVSEGGSKGYTVALATQPTGEVTVTVGGTTGTDLDVDKASLTFSTTEWATAQTVTVSAGEDVDAVDDSATLTHTASGGDYGSVSEDLAVTVTDDDTAGLELSKTSLDVAEGGSDTYTVALATQPTGEVTVTVGGTMGTDLNVDKASLTFSTMDWSTAQTVTVSAGQDADAVDDSATLTHTASGADYGSVSKDLAVTVTDDETAGLTLSAPTLTVSEGASKGYTVALATQPTGEVTVTIGGTTGTDLDVDKASLTFSTTDWSTAQTVTVSAGEDADAVDDSATLTHTASGGDYGSVSEDLAVTVTDDETAGLTLSAPTLTVSEGASKGYTVALATQPTGEVTVTVGGTTGTDLNVDKASLTFSTTDWSTAQTVTVSAGQDADAVDDSATLTHTASGADYGSVSEDLAVTVTDDETAGLTLSAPTLTVSEGASKGYTVALATQPTGEVTVTVGGTTGTDLDVDKASLTFSTTEWATAQTVTVSAGEDVDAVDDSATLTHTASGGDYGSMSEDLAVTVTDDDTAGLELSEMSLDVAEGGSDTYTVALATQPTGEVTVTVGGTMGTDLNVDKASLTFSTMDWSTAQTVTVSAGQDADAVDDRETLTHTASGADYGSVSKDLAVTVTEDDTAGLELSETLVTVPEGGSSTYTVKLSLQPTGEVTVTVGGTTGTDLDVDKASLTFSTTDWSTVQTVTVSAGQDADAVDDRETLTHTASGGDYGSVSKDLAVTVTEDDTAGLELSETSLDVAEGGNGTYTVALATQPTGEVTVTVGGTTGTDLNVDKASLTFSTTDWSTVQTVTVSAGQDADAVDDSATLKHTASGGGYGSVSKDLAVTVTEDDTAGLELSETSLDVAEGGSDTYTVALATQPTGEVTVTVGGTTGTDLDVDKASLTFSTTEWATAQTVTVSAGQDADAVDDSATLTHTASGGDYGSVSKDLAVTVTEDDTAGLELSETLVTVPEGGSSTYTVKLSLQPTGEVTVTVGGTTGTDLSVDEASLTFSTTEWATAQTVTVSAGQDADAVDDSATLTHTASGADYGSVSKDLAVTVTDDDTAALELSETSLDVAEGGSDTYTVKLSLQPTGEVTVTVGGTTGTDLDVDKASLTFSTTEWATAQTVTVSAGQDADAVDDTATLTHTASGGGYGSVSKDLAVTVTEDDTAGLELSKTSVTVAEGGSSAYTVKLSLQPTGEVTVTVGGTTGTDLDVDKASLTFSTTEWATAQTVTVSAGEDADADDDTATLTHTASGGGYGSVSKDLAVTVTDDETAVVAKPAKPAKPVLSVDSATVTEANTALQFTLRLSHASAEPVKVRYATADGTATALSDYAPMSGTLTFTPGNKTGTVAVTLHEDSLDEPDEFFTLTLSEPSHAVFPGGYATLSATGTIVDDDDAPQLTIGDARAMEDVGQIVFQVRLDRASGRPITVVCRSEDGTATTPDDYELEIGVVTLEPGQTSAEIRIGLMDDLVPEPNETFKVILSEPSHVELATTSATGTIVDDDAALSRAWLSRFGRTVATEVLGAVDDRLSGSAGTESQVNVGGHRLRPTVDPGEPDYALLAGGGEFRSMQLAELIGGSSFFVTNAADTLLDAPKPYEDSGTNGEGGSWALWSRGGATQLAGSSGEVGVSGQVITGIAGFDYDWGSLLAGVAVAHSVGSGQLSLSGRDQPARNLTVGSSLTSVHPYLRIAPADGVALWALLGYGLGDMDLAGGGKTGIEMKLAAVGARGPLLSPDPVGGSISLDVKSDAFLVLVNTREPAGMQVVTANASRVRLVLAGAVDVPLGAAGVVRPSAEVGVRYDAGDAETGSGVELGGGVRYTLPAWGLTIDGSARVLVAHQVRDYREWGASGSLRLDPGTPGRGLSFLLSSSWGSAASATERLWSAHDATALVGDDRSSAGGRVNAELGYAIGVSDEGVVTPIAALALDEHGGRTYRLGGLLNQGTNVSISLEGTRTEAGGGDPDQSVTLTTTLRW